MMPLMQKPSATFCVLGRPLSFSCNRISFAMRRQMGCDAPRRQRSLESCSSSVPAQSNFWTRMF